VKLFVTSRLLSAEGIAHGFSLRNGGVSEGPFASLNLGGHVGDSEAAVAENHRLLRDAVGLGQEIATAHQVHGDRIVDERGREVLPATGALDEGADGVVALSGGAVGVRVADCVPVLLAAGEAVAAVHSGWRGTRLGIAARGVRALQHAVGADPAHIIAAVGPCIGRCCYEVSAELASTFRALFGAEAADDPDKTPRPHLDLRHCVERSLLGAGLKIEHIDQVEGCTSCDRSAYFSHRRDKGRTGRHIAFIEAR
jgi:YfiH family protein